MVITPQSELDAVNEILSSVGATPVSTLEDDTDIDTINAYRILKAVSREVQSRGWYFNTQTSVTLYPDTYTSLVPYPQSYLRVIADGYQLIRKSGYFFDLVDQTNKFDSGLTLDELVEEFEFEDLPEPFKYYITVRSTRAYQIRYMTSQEVDRNLQQDEQEAYSAVIDFDLQQANYNILEDDETISNYTQRS